MNLVISHDSALELLRIISAENPLRTTPTRACIAGDPLSDTQATRLAHALSLSLPVHIMVAKEAKRPRTNNVVHHARTAPLPHGSLLRVGSEALVASPELAFVQLSPRCKLAGHIGIGYELCGSYRSGGRYDQVPLTSVGKLSTYLKRAGRMHGIEQARRALKHVLPNSASHMETTLSMLWSLPPLLGGCSLTPPQLNVRFDPGKRAKDMTSQTYYRCDLYWKKAKLAVEYESDLYHTGAHRIARDSRRRDELSALGITVTTVTSHQVYNLSAFNKVTKTVARHLGERLPKRDKRFTERQLELRSILLNDLER